MKCKIFFRFILYMILHLLWFDPPILLLFLFFSFICTRSIHTTAGRPRADCYNLLPSLASVQGLFVFGLAKPVPSNLQWVRPALPRTASLLVRLHHADSLGLLPAASSDWLGKPVPSNLQQGRPLLVRRHLVNYFRAAPSGFPLALPPSMKD